MAGHDDEGSGRMTDDVDDEEYHMQGSGDGSGAGKFNFIIFLINIILIQCLHYFFRSLITTI